MNKRLALALMIVSLISLCSVAYGAAVQNNGATSSQSTVASSTPSSSIQIYNTGTDDFAYNTKRETWLFREDSSSPWIKVRPGSILKTNDNKVIVIDANKEPLIKEDGKFVPLQVSPKDKGFEFTTKKTGPGVGDTLYTDKSGNQYFYGNDGYLYFTDKDGKLHFESTHPEKSKPLIPEYYGYCKPGSECASQDKCLGVGIVDGICMSASQKKQYEDASFMPWDQSASLGSNIALLVDDLMVTAQFGEDISRLFGWDSSTWEKSMDKFFTENVFGQIISGNWEESFCRGDFFNQMVDSVVVSDDENLYYGMHVEGLRSEKGSYYNETTGQTEDHYVYMITFRVMNTNDDPNGFNLIFYGPDTPFGLVYYIDNQGLRTDRPLAAGTSFTASMNSAFVAQGRNLYNKVCVALTDPIEDFQERNRDQVCNAIVVTAGDEGISGGSGHGGIGGEGSGSSGPIQNGGF